MHCGLQTMSCISRTQLHFELEEDDAVLEYRVEKVFKTIPYDERIHLFSLCSQMVKQRQAEARQQKQA